MCPLFRPELESPSFFAGLYFAIGVFLDLFLLGATAFAGVNYSTNAEAFQKAVKEVQRLFCPLHMFTYQTIFAWKTSDDRCLLHNSSDGTTKRE